VLSHVVTSISSQGAKYAPTVPTLFQGMGKTDKTASVYSGFESDAGCGGATQELTILRVGKSYPLESICLTIRNRTQ